MPQELTLEALRGTLGLGTDYRLRVGLKVRYLSGYASGTCTGGGRAVQRRAPP